MILPIFLLVGAAVLARLAAAAAATWIDATALLAPCAAVATVPRARRDTADSALR